MSEPTFSHPHFDPTYNFGHVMMVAGSVASVLIMFASIIWWQSNFQTRMENEIDLNTKARSEYIPVIHELLRIQAVTNVQLSSLASSSGALQNINREQDASLANIKERVSAIESRLKLYGMKPIK